ncbi:Lrp/AsnC family transcriptional regulator [Ideonella livida]|uniref:Lrp/AsnC family transcriptional regulator n=1 Tax=Ideonella livida TaxID=2707176 RepID=A0A7C9TN15_9BURK|nr:Lrp/AsnC family transcriptional regulator [Ideonella livida]NDY93782.1 Lrp/AsnC family transcriptional regulator [Ideonella livida]
MSENCSQDGLDATDRALLRLLQEDATLSNAELGERLALSVTPCWRRRKRLEALGYIRGYQASLDRRKLGHGVLAYVQLRFADHATDAPDRFERALQAWPQVLACHKVTGDADYLLTVLAADLDAYGQFIEQVLRKQPGLSTIQSTLSLREIKATSRLPV